MNLFALWLTFDRTVDSLGALIRFSGPDGSDRSMEVALF